MSSCAASILVQDHHTGAIQKLNDRPPNRPLHQQNSTLARPVQKHRNPRYSADGFHDAVRFAEREGLADYNPAFAVAPDDDDLAPGKDDGSVGTVFSQMAALFVSAGWDAVLVADCVEHVAYRPAVLPSRLSVVEALRSDHAFSELLGLPSRSSPALLRIVLGHPAPKHTGTPTSNGVLLRLPNVETLDLLRDDEDLMDAICAAHPGQARRSANPVGGCAGQSAHMTA